jgi:argininosuccinate lyase
LEAIPLGELREISDAFGEDFASNVTLEKTLDCHDVAGGTARAQVAAALDAMDARLKALEAEDGNA